MSSTCTTETEESDMEAIGDAQYLPPEVWFKVMAHLSPKELYGLKVVCSQWYYYITSDTPWKSYANKYFFKSYGSTMLYNDMTMNWGDKFWKISKLHHNWMTGEKKTTTLLGFQAPLRHMKISGRHLACASGRSLKIWDTDNSRCIYLVHEDSSHSYIPSFDVWGKFVVIPTNNDRPILSIVDFEAKKRVQRIHTTQPTTVVRYSPTTNLLAAGGRKIMLWDVEHPNNPLLTLPEQRGGVVNCMELEGSTITACHKGKKIRMWDIRSGNRIHTLAGHHHLIHCIGINSVMIASGSKDATLKLWDRRMDCRPITKLEHATPIRALAMDEWKVATGGKDNSVILWDCTTQEKMCKITELDSVYALAMDESRLYVGSTLLLRHDFTPQKRPKPFDCIIS